MDGHRLIVAAKPVRGVAIQDRLWPVTKRQFTVYFLNGDASGKQYVKDVVDHHYNKSRLGLTFIFSEDCSPEEADIRIMFADHSECYVGCEAKGHGHKPTMWLREYPDIPKSDQRRFVMEPDILHEFGHALGLEHEHQHRDYAAEWDIEMLCAKHGWTPEDVRFNYDKITRADALFSRYDPKSIMHYPVDPGDTKNNVASVPRNRVLSHGDKEWLRQLYPPERALRARRYSM